ncbi:spore germination protein [Paenibacillus sp. UNCCL117]|uniref:spore germination protein n=1 Tax=unclassified Paenibacillus TaxID=185978 RepID=UPI00088705E6|nr:MULTISPECIES: spore germination protein [unclassified Paenibacillus]SDC85545.1 spore germination protein [Paenibacillus sp. cl123]SFW27574.1 spore germination protein [Paenibacillus sp. UNCCL117]
MSEQTSAAHWDELTRLLGSPADLVSNEFHCRGLTVKLLYISSICDEAKIHEMLLARFYEMSKHEEFSAYLQALSGPALHSVQKDIVQRMLQGAVVVDFGALYVIELRKAEHAQPLEASIEKVIQGPQNAFSQNLQTNISMLRNRYPQASLTVELFKIGRLTRTPVALVYDRNLTDPATLLLTRQTLESAGLDTLQGLGQLQNRMTRTKRSLFPTIMITERPDRAVYNIAQGKIVLLDEGTPFSLVVPAAFYDFISSMEDLYHSYWISRFLLGLRYIGLLISVTLPALYVGVTAYNPELFRVQLALSIAGSRVSVPYPAFLEVLFMLLMMELLTEASVRLPKTIGSTATTVGGLILGQAATEAGLVSNIMIIIVSAVAISNFVIPINAMSFAMRVVRYGLLALTILLGMIGMIFGMLGLIAYLIYLDSFGQPYFRLFARPPNSERL